MVNIVIFCWHVCYNGMFSSPGISQLDWSAGRIGYLISGQKFTVVCGNCYNIMGKLPVICSKSTLIIGVFIN